MQPSSTTIDPTADDEAVEVNYEPDQAKAVEELRRKLSFSPDEVEQRLRRTQAGLKRIAAATTLQEQQRIGAQVWAEQVERPRAARRVQAARRVAPVLAVIVRRARAREQRSAGTRRTSSSSRTSSTDPGDDPDPESLARLARRPLQPRRELLGHLAERRRAIKALLARDQQLTLEDVA